jgi:hypothetical protein
MTTTSPRPRTPPTPPRSSRLPRTSMRTHSDSHSPTNKGHQRFSQVASDLVGVAGFEPAPLRPELSAQPDEAAASSRLRWSQTSLGSRSPRLTASGCASPLPFCSQNRDANATDCERLTDLADQLLSLRQRGRQVTASDCIKHASKCAHQRPRQAGTARNVRLNIPADRAGRPRTQANETTFETTSRPRP